jgi:hypothetical protein
LLGRVAGPTIGRLALRGDAFNSGFGYAVYFTNNRIVGLSYTKLLSRSYYPAYVLILVFGASLASVLILAQRAGVPQDQPIPYYVVWAPIVFGLLTLSTILLFVRPWQMGKWIRRNAPASLVDLTSQSPDLVLERQDISQVSIDNYRFNILTKSNQWYCFTVKVVPRYYSKPLKWKREPRQLFDLFQRCCSMDPPIPLFLKQGRQWTLLTQTQTP